MKGASADGGFWPAGDDDVHHGLKRTLPNDRDDSDQHGSKRSTRVPLNAPTSSALSFELAEKPDVADRARAHHLQPGASPSGFTSYSMPGAQLAEQPREPPTTDRTGDGRFGFRCSNSYTGQDETTRFNAVPAYDPARTKKEFNALLQNIQTEEVPEHLRVHTPEAMAVSLHKYQELGLTWLKNCEEGPNKGGILADDMGLGKTIQMLSLLVSRRSEDPACKTTLVVAPLALLRQWEQEIKTKIKPDSRHCLSVYTHHGQRKKKNFSDLKIYDVVLTTYESMAAEFKKLKHNTLPNANDKCALIGDDAKWYRVILDEAHTIKNRGTQTAKAAYQLNAKYRFCMTGTPMMNSVDELFSLIYFLRINPYCTWEKFQTHFVQPLKQDSDALRQESMHLLQTLCNAIMLRRTKQSTSEGKPILMLPERTTEVAHPEFSEDEKQFYSVLEQRTKFQFNKYLRDGTVGKSYLSILGLLLRLRQACCHPHLIKDFDVSVSTMKSAEELDPHTITRIEEKYGNFECPVCYDAATNPVNADGDKSDRTNVTCPECSGDIKSKDVIDFHQRELLNKDQLESVDHHAEGYDRENPSEHEDGKAGVRNAYLNKHWVSSAKIEKTLEILQTIMNNNQSEKVLVFSQWTSLLDLLEIPIDCKGWDYRRYDGSMLPRMRDDAVDDFRDDRKGVRIMLISLKAGNAGLNLNMANQVIILDPSWNPYIEEQAIDRAHRLGQTKPVEVHRVLVQGTVEDRIIALQEKKRALIREALDEKADQSIARLGVQELAFLFDVGK